MTAGNIGTAHAFTTRYGGVSRGVYASLNLAEGRGDDETCVRENYDRLAAALGTAMGDFVFSRQVHGDGIRRVGRDDRHVLFTKIPYEADGLVTNEPRVPLIIFIADCAPVLLFDPIARAVGAVHAGWRGTVLDVAGKGIDALRRAFGSRPEDIRAAVGPCISSCCYETGADVARAVEDLGAEFRACVAPRGEKFLVDLKELNRRLLIRAGVRPEHIEVSGECTMCSRDKYWSHRASGGRRGSQAAVIMLSPGIRAPGADR